MRDDTHNGVSELSFADMIDGMLVFITGPVVSGTVCPGFLLCVPGLVLFGAAIAVPIIALAAVAVLAGAITAIPCLLVRGAVRLLRRPGLHHRDGD